MPLRATATNRPLPYVTSFHKLSAAEVRAVQVIPSGLVITRLPVPLFATATNRPLPYVTLLQLLSAAEAREVQITPSWLVITRLPVPLFATATNRPLPYVTLRQDLFGEGAARAVQVTPPSSLVITRLVPFVDTATNRPPPNVTSVQVFASAAVRVVQVTPSGLVTTRFKSPVAPAPTATNCPWAYVTALICKLLLGLGYGVHDVPPVVDTPGVRVTAVEAGLNKTAPVLSSIAVALNRTW